MSVTEIESAITQLPAKEVAELMAWLQNYHDENVESRGGAVG
jgi:hypothetical protein